MNICTGILILNAKSSCNTDALPAEGGKPTVKRHAFRNKHNTDFVGDSLKHEPVDSTAL